MIPFESISSLPEYKTAEPERQQLVKDEYAKDFWAEVISDPEYLGADEQDRAELQQIFDQKFGAGVREAVEKVVAGHGGPGYDIIGGIKDFGKLIYDIPVQTLGAAGRLVEDPMVRGEKADELVTAATERTKQRAQEITAEERGKKVFPLPEVLSEKGAITRGDIQDTATSTGFSGVSMAAGVVGGVAGRAAGALAVPAVAMIAAPLAPWAPIIGKVGGQLLASGYAAFRMDKSMVSEQLVKAAEATKGTALTDEEVVELLTAAEPTINNHALWEAGPEAIGNALEIAGLGSIFKGAIKGKLGKVIAGFIGNLGAELSTETVTQKGQNRAEIELGLQNGPEISWPEALQQVGPQTLLLAGGTSSGAYVAGKARNAIFPQQEAPPAPAPIIEPTVPDTVDILAGESIDDAIAAFRETLGGDTPQPSITETGAPSTAGEAAAVFESLPPSQTETALQAQEDLAIADQANEQERVVRQAELEQTFNQEPERTAEESAAIIAATPITDLEQKLDKQEDVAQFTGKEYSTAPTTRIEKQEAITAVIGDQGPDFTAAKGKPFATLKSMQMSAKQKGIDLANYKEINIDGGHIAVPKPKGLSQAKEEVYWSRLQKKYFPKDWTEADQKSMDEAEVVAGREPVQAVEEVKNLDSLALGQPVNVAPTEAQKEAGNYQKAHISLDGMEISIENPAGSERSGVDEDGRSWSQEMATDYGYIKGTVGFDKDHVDTFITPGYTGGNGQVFVVNQFNKAGEFDEHKVVLGASSAEQAMKVYNSNYAKGWDGGKTVVPMTTQRFREWAKSDAPRQGQVYAFAEKNEAGLAVSEGLSGKTVGHPASVNAPSAKPAPGKSAEKDFARNKFFTEKAVNAARENLKKNRNRLGAGLDPELMGNVITIGGAHFERGVRDLAAWSTEMVRDLGESVRSYLEEGYRIVSNHPAFSKRTTGKAGEYYNYEPEQTIGGKYKGAPDGVTDKKSLDALRGKVARLVKEGDVGRFWYENSANSVLRMMDGDVANADKFIQLLAIYSPLARVGANTTMAVRAWNQFKAGVKKEDFKVKTSSQDAKAVDVLYNNKPFVGRKTNSFYINLVSQIVYNDPSAVAKMSLDADLLAEITRKSTIDMWMVRAFGYRDDNVYDDAGAGKYSFVENEVSRLTDRLNASLSKGEKKWVPFQVQASIWTAMKSRYEDPSVKAKTWEESIGKGLAYFDETGQRALPKDKGKMRQHRRIWYENAMGLSSTKARANAGESGADFGTFIEQATSTVTWEALPSIAVAPDLIDSSSAIKKMFTDEARNLLVSDEGTDLLAERLGVGIAFIADGSGAYGGNVNPNSLSHLIPSKTGATFAPNTARAYARAIQYIFKQDAVPWYRADSQAILTKGGRDSQQFRVLSPKGAPLAGARFDTLTEATAAAQNRGDGYSVKGGPLARGVIVDFQENLTPEKEANILQVLQGYLGKDIGFSRISANEISIINFRDDTTGVPFTDDEVFLGQVQDFLDNNNESLGMSEAKKLWVNGEYGYVHNWSEDEQGEAILAQRGIAERSDIFGWLRGKRSEFERIVSRYTGEQLKVREADLKSIEKLGGVKFQVRTVENLVHWDQKPGLPTLDPSLAGAGLPGAERKRKDSDPGNWVNRVYYGIEGGGYRKEPGLGPYRYNVSVQSESLYDFTKDPDEIMAEVKTAAAKDLFVNKTNLYEKKIKEHGYTGYWTSTPGMGKVAAVFEALAPVSSTTQPEPGVKLQQSRVAGIAAGAPSDIFDILTLTLSDDQRTIANRLVSSGKVVLMDTKQAMIEAREAGYTKAELDKNFQPIGLEIPGQTILIPENIPDGELWGSLRHAMGVHIGLMAQRNSEFQGLKKSVLRRQDEKSPTGDAIRRAMEQIPPGTDPNNYSEEILAYMVSTSEDVGIVRRVIAMVKNFVTRFGVSYKIFSEKDFLALADIAIRREATSDSKTIFDTDGIKAQISPQVAREIDIEVELPSNPLFAMAVAATPGAAITKDGLLIDLVRHQKPELGGERAIRTGVFYLPAGDKNAHFYSNNKSNYGGSAKFEGATLLKRPLFVKGATGGNAVENAFKTLRGGDEFKEMEQTLYDTVLYGKPSVARISQFLDRWGGVRELAGDIVAASTESNTLIYAIKENIIANTIRTAGYDSMVAYSTRQDGEKTPFISEVFDVREQTYPSKVITPEIHDSFPMREAPKFQMAGAQSSRANTSMLHRAFEMEDAGEGREAIWKETGWWQMAGDDWQYEIDDSLSELTLPGSAKRGTYGGPLGFYFVNKPLFDAYPILNDLTIKIVPLPSSENGSFTAKTKTITINSNLSREVMLSTIHHELQHAIQNIEGFPLGGNVSEFFSKRKAEVNKWYSIIEGINAEMTVMGSMDKALQSTKLWKDKYYKLIDERSGYIEKIQDAEGADSLGLQRAAFRDYQTLAGEMSARLVEVRRLLTPAQRKTMPPWESLEQMLYFEGLLAPGTDPVEIMNVRRYGDLASSAQATPLQGSLPVAAPLIQRLSKSLDITGKFDELATWLWDEDQAIHRIQDGLGPQDELRDYATLRGLVGKVVAEGIRNFDREMLQPFLQYLADNKQKIADVESLAHAQYAPERNLQMKRKNARQNIDWMLNQMTDKEKEPYQKRLGDIQDEYVMLGQTLNEKRDNNVILMDDMISHLKAQRKQVEQLQADLDSRVFTATEISKGTTEWHQKRLDNLFSRLEKRESIAARWDDIKDRLSGMTNSDAAAIVSRLGTPEMLEATRKLREMDAAALDLEYASGDLTAEEYSAIKNTYKWHVPLMREGMEEGKVATGKRGVGPLGPAERAATGSTRAVVHILGNIVDKYQGAISRGEKLKAGRALYELVKANQDENLWSIGELDKAPYVDNEGNVRFYPDQQLDLKTQTYVKVDGVKHIIEVNKDNPAAVRFMEAINRQVTPMGPITKASAFVNRILARLSTTLTPEFTLPNVVRDLQTAFVNLSSTEADGMKWKVFGNIKNAVKGIMMEEFGEPSGTWGTIYRDAAKNGVVMGWAQSYENVTELSKKIERDLEIKEGKRPVQETFMKIGGYIESVNRAFENGVRVATYQALVDSGIAKSKAAGVASGLTVDFTKHGTAGPLINAWWMFANAGIQGNVRMIKAVASSNKVRKIVGGIVAFGIFSNIMGSIMGGDDEDGESYYDKLKRKNPALFERNVVIMVPFSGGNYFKLPMAYGYNIPFSLGNEIGSVMRGQNPLEATMRFMFTAMNNLNPLAAGTILQTLAPTVIDPIVQVRENRAWHGGPLMPALNPWIGQPDSERYFNNVNPVIKSVTTNLNDLTGGNKYREGAISVSPETIEMILETFTGGAGKLLKDVATLPIGIFEGDVPMGKVPVARRFFGTIPENINAGIYYDNREEMDVFAKELKNATREERRELVRDPLYKLVGPFQNIEQSIAVLTKQKKSIEAKGGDTGDVVNRIRKLQTNFNKRYNDATGRG